MTAHRLDSVGYHVLAIDLRGHGLSHGPASTSRRIGIPLDGLAAIGYLRAHGASSVTLVGASMGGWAAGQAAIEAGPGQVQALVVLDGSAHAQYLFGTDPGPRLMHEILDFLERGTRAPAPRNGGRSRSATEDVARGATSTRAGPLRP